ncbi:Zn-ribbon domain-containing OB-fold protein [Leptospira noguchii]|uniref:PF01796 domain protein n=2 Tax=Leptospira noguchii TaxID=28182 RepID=T0FT13_9LEPT|nr:OB-fold domain-containing protein [Leptospira noguchii]EMO55760.1 PF01796 domain protein [Leptospira noguchii]EQA72650.1 PF01796 domain protein [Leptospira noguchii serovar Panama str. CZ214]MCH1912488.1 OB-fold domain-containing protein [Leptospira noguchii]MCH1916189.1 OB-fold domain-containing protein [Leptospira noguchii]UOG63566.1 OB-fold domain-containing protein [Leptospira noguchii]
MSESILEILKGKRCDSCGFQTVETIIACTRCGSSKTSEIQFSGKGTIYTYTIVYVGFGHLSKRVPYVLAVVELEEGIKTIGILEGKISGIPVTESVKIDIPVRFQKDEPGIGFIFNVV